MNKKSTNPDRELVLIITAFAAVILIVLLFAGCILLNLPDKPPPEGEQTTSPVTTATPEQADTIPETTVPISSSYDYSKPVPSGAVHGKEWFDDAVIIGNSRAVGIINYNAISGAKSYVTTGLNVSTVFTDKSFTVNGVSVSATEAVAADTNFSKVYIMLGVNELGWPYESVFGEKYAALVDAIRLAKPDARIYAVLILPITKTVSDADAVFNNVNVNRMNAAIRKVAQDKKIFFVDCSEVVADNDGFLSDPTSADGIHLSKSYSKLVMDYILSHTVN